MTSFNVSEIIANPIFFERNRVFRVYLGGLLMHDFFGDEECDGNYPEEWIASSVKALNKGNGDNKKGISKIKGHELYFDQLINEYKKEMLGDRDNLGILVKVLDSAIRLPIQVHPDKAFSKRYFKSEYGKAEMWLVLDTRGDSSIYFGFRNKTNKEEFLRAIRQSCLDKDSLANMLNKIPVKRGDVIFIPPRIVHAIGEGCLILEIQEPTDYTIQPESFCGDYLLNDFEKYLGLDENIALECFDYSVYGKETINKGFKTPNIIRKDKNVTTEDLFGSENVRYFSVLRHVLNKGHLNNLNGPAVYIVIEGEGLLRKDDYKKQIKKGDYFFISNLINHRCSIETNNSIVLIECSPPEIHKGNLKV